MRVTINDLANAIESFKSMIDADPPGLFRARLIEIEIIPTEFDKPVGSAKFDPIATVVFVRDNPSGDWIIELSDSVTVG